MDWASGKGRPPGTASPSLGTLKGSLLIFIRLGESWYLSYSKITCHRLTPSPGHSESLHPPTQWSLSRRFFLPLPLSTPSGIPLGRLWYPNPVGKHPGRSTSTYAASQAQPQRGALIQGSACPACQRRQPATHGNVDLCNCHSPADGNENHCFFFCTHLKRRGSPLRASKPFPVLTHYQLPRIQEGIICRTCPLLLFLLHKTGIITPYLTGLLKASIKQTALRFV